MPLAAVQPLDRVPRPPTPSGHIDFLKWMLVAFALVIAFFFASLLLWIFGSETGIGALLVGVSCATIPVPIYAAMLLWIDRFEPEPAWMLILTFLWGALVATFVSVIVNSVVETAFGKSYSLMYSAPIVEESMKAQILFILFITRKADFDGVVDGIVYAGMVALGFAMTENISYYSRELLGDGNLPATFFVRGILSPFAHPLFTSMTGIGLGIARETKNIFIKLTAPLVGLGMAMVLHHIWNHSTLLAEGAGFIFVYFLLMVPTFFGMLGVIAYALIREGRMVRRNLAPELASGVLTLKEVVLLGSVLGRLGASTKALTQSGFGAWIAQRRFHEAASLLAFHRNRQDCGTVACDAEANEREAELLAWLRYRKQELRG